MRQRILPRKVRAIGRTKNIGGEPSGFPSKMILKYFHYLFYLSVGFDERSVPSPMAYY
jgi:hypothetical protein